MKNNLTLTMMLSMLSFFVIGTLTTAVYAQENMTDSDMPKFFAIQHAQSGSLSEINETAYSLELNNVSDKTILFSDRPDIIVTSVSTFDFIGNWSAGQDSFAVDVPNGVLMVYELDKQYTGIISLFNLVYDSNKKTLKYDVTPDDVKSVDLSGEFGLTTLVIYDERVQEVLDKLRSFK